MIDPVSVAFTLLGGAVVKAVGDAMPSAEDVVANALGNLLTDGVKNAARRIGSTVGDTLDPQTQLPRNHPLLSASRDALRTALLAMLYRIAQQRDPRLPLFSAIGQFVREGRLWREPLIAAMERPDLNQLRDLERAVKSPQWEQWFDDLRYEARDLIACIAGARCSLTPVLLPALEQWIARQLGGGTLPDFIAEPLRGGWLPSPACNQTITLEQAYCLCLREYLKERPEVFRSFVADMLGNLQADADQLLERIGTQHSELLVRLEQQAQTLRDIRYGQDELKQQMATLLAAVIALPQLGDDLSAAVRAVTQAFGALQQQLFGLPLYRFAALPPPPASAEQGDLWIIQAKYRSLPLLGREAEMRSLWGWLHSDRSIAVRLLVGDAGAGKTRLGYELIWRLAREYGERWQAGVLLHDDLQRLATLQSGSQWQWQRPTLVLVDYARASDAALRSLLRELSFRAVNGSTPKFRLLLLERRLTGTKDWLDELGSVVHRGGHAARSLFDPPEPLPLPLFTDLELRRRLFSGTLAAIHSSVRTPEAGERPDFDALLNHRDWSAPLLPMMAALVTQQRGHLLASHGLHRSDLGAALARGERERLLRFAHIDQAHPAQADAFSTLLSVIAAWVVLRGGADRDTALAIANAESEARALNFPGGNGVLIDALLKAWTGGPNQIAALQPDIVAEAFVVLFLGNPQQAGDTATRLLARVHDREHSAVHLILLACQNFQSFPEVPMAFKALSAWVKEIAEAACQQGDAQLLSTLAYELPKRSLEFSAVAKTVAVLCVDIQRLRVEMSLERSETELYELAGQLFWLAVHLNALGQRREALAPAQEATDLCRALAEQNANAYTPALASSLNNLASFLSEAGLRREALASAQKAVILNRELVARDAHAYRPTLASSLNNLASFLSEVGQRREALAPAQEATDLSRALVAQNAEAYTPALAMSLHNLANRLSEVGRRREALASAQEAVTLRRALVAQNADAYKPALASSLNNLAGFLSETGQQSEALIPAQEATDLYRTLAEQNADAYTPALASSLDNLASFLSEAGRWKEALALAREATNLHRALAEQNADAYTPALASSLSNLANRLSEAGQRCEALALAREATSLHRALATQNADAYAPALASSLSNLANRLSGVGQRREALALALEATNLHRALAEQNADAYRPALASSLNNLSSFLSAVGQPLKALASAQEAVMLRRVLVGKNADAYTPALAMSLNTFANQLRAANREDEAQEPAREATELCRALVAQNADVYRPILISTLNTLAILLSEAGQWCEALALAREAVDESRVLAEQNADAYTPVLAGSLNTLANRLNESEQRSEALALSREATDLRRALAEQNADVYMPSLANSLGTTAAIYACLSDFNSARDCLREALDKLSSLFLQLPEAHGMSVLRLFLGYLRACNYSGTAPDSALLKPLIEPLRALPDILVPVDIVQAVKGQEPD
ncbi:Tetratricopeptide repeat-containing protein [Solimonas aquatica]|uniref:Tetratricopeptide repeat-containing protein n=1 Tax=Solimonas aquatica TaxID=489703 RepID=A0A1H9GHW0_9GAMM|nr:tetratricopeptide repeat protein [Solimonas aquatica]SEQ49674.1 Tetratricopeptide repeat-containing protein [Solimonas aquatica]